MGNGIVFDDGIQALVSIPECVITMKVNLGIINLKKMGEEQILQRRMSGSEFDE